jgi:hypothetical protein
MVRMSDFPPVFRATTCAVLKMFQRVEKPSLNAESISCDVSERDRKKTRSFVPTMAVLCLL